MNQMSTCRDLLEFCQFLPLDTKIWFQKKDKITSLNSMLNNC